MKYIIPETELRKMPKDKLIRMLISIQNMATEYSDARITAVLEYLKAAKK